MYHARELKRMSETAIAASQSRITDWLSDQMENPFCVAALARGDGYRMALPQTIPRQHLEEVMKGIGSLLDHYGFVAEFGSATSPPTHPVSFLVMVRKDSYP